MKQIKLQVALINPLMHVKGYAAPETKAAVERARLLIEQAEALGEPPEDPLLLFSVLYGFWVANYVAFNGDVIRELAAQFLALAEKQGATLPLVTGHRLMGASLLHTGEIAQGRGHLDQAITLYNPAEHRPLAPRFRPRCRGWQLVLPVVCAVAAWLSRGRARGRRLARSRTRATIGQAATLMAALALTSLTHISLRNYAVAKAQLR